MLMDRSRLGDESLDEGLDDRDREDLGLVGGAAESSGGRISFGKLKKVLVDTRGNKERNRQRNTISTVFFLFGCCVYNIVDGQHVYVANVSVPLLLVHLSHTIFTHCVAENIQLHLRTEWEKCFVWF